MRDVIPPIGRQGSSDRVIFRRAHYGVYLSIRLFCGWRITLARTKA